MGLINASLGGSRIEPWLSAPALRATGGQDAALNALARYATDQVAAGADWAEVWTKWVARVAWGWPMTSRGIPPLLLRDGAMRRALWSDTSNGVCQNWPRSPACSGIAPRVKLTAQQAAQEATLSLGNVDEIDQTWVNGIGAGSGVPRLHATARPAACRRQPDRGQCTEHV